ncbi:hypothetical protein B566_EDAN006350 [Ephemera danica]|nr:hypothetical protein B566_EDAN006350 [Ephemera danica]
MLLQKMTSGLRHIATEPANLNRKFFGNMDKKKSNVARSKSKSAGHGSDSEGSVDSNSLSAESNNDTFVKVPLKETACILIYAKGPGEIARGKLHGSLDIGLSVISSKLKRKRIDIDAEEFIYHLKAKSVDIFRHWVEQLKRHRLYRQHILTFGNREIPLHRQTTVSPDASPSANVSQPAADGSQPGSTAATPDTLARGALPSTQPPSTSTTSSALQAPSASRIANWIMDSSALDLVSRELALIQQNMVQLNLIMEQIEMLPAGSEHGDITDGCSPNVKKDRKKFGLRKKKSSKGSAADLAGWLAQMSQLSSSNPSLPSAVLAAARPQSLSGAEHLLTLGSSISGDSCRLSTTPDHHCREDFAILAKDIMINLKEATQSLLTERDRLKQAVELDGGVLLGHGSTGATNSAIVASLRAALSSALQQNNDLKNRLNRIHENSDLSDVSSIAHSEQVKSLQQSLSYSSSCLSASEFYDAQESQGGQAEGEISETSSEASLSSEEGSVTSENSELGTDCTPAQSTATTTAALWLDTKLWLAAVVEEEEALKCLTGRRTKLPAPRPDLEGLSLWNLLCKNIGKDLSKISMPVALNEPLSMLQRLCEELEYSELLDKAADQDDPFERMVCVAAFAVSSYGSSYYRAASKPFNPILGETFECIREDKGFRFIAEQVSHHPPVSVCHAESRNFIFWQDARIKTKFWGKSMEFQPAGTVNVKLPRTGDLYRWSKVTTCVHNVFGGQRWVDQYGELCITSNSGIKCKLTFVRASYWSAKRHEVFGSVTNTDGKVVRTLFGKWNEALYCGVAPSARCIWRPGTMPEDYEIYYGFTRFAMELNENDPEMSKYLPCTDTRFRPDQRLLEEGNLAAAETMKQQLEQAQRERRKNCEIVHLPRWFQKVVGPDGEETWQYLDTYWSNRKNPGFMNLNIPPIW